MEKESHIQAIRLSDSQNLTCQRDNLTKRL